MDGVMPLLRPAKIAVTLALIGLSAACRIEAGGGPAPGQPSDPSPVNDPALLAAADRVRPMLQTTFSATFAGLQLDQPSHTMVIYRKPDPRLEAAVASEHLGVNIAYRDARFSLVEMNALTS
jgi:hypothetical protein